MTGAAWRAMFVNPLAVGIGPRGCAKRERGRSGLPTHWGRRLGHAQTSSRFASLTHSMSRDSSAGRASDRRSEGPRFDPGSRHSFSSPGRTQVNRLPQHMRCGRGHVSLPAAALLEPLGHLAAGCIVFATRSVSWHLRILSGRDSSAGRASDRRSEGPRFDPGSRHCEEVGPPLPLCIA